MSIAYARAQIIGRATGRSLMACIAYRHGKCIYDDRLNLTHDYTRKDGVLAQGVMLPDQAPAWMQDLERLGQAIERREDRSTRPNQAQLVREYVIALPHELDDAQREALVTAIVMEGAVRQGMVALWAIHAPSREGDNRNHHAHVMVTLRELDATDPCGFGRKVREWNQRRRLTAFKTLVEQQVNRSLDLAGLEHSIQFALSQDHEATVHLGPQAMQLERRGIATRLGDLNRAIQARNSEVRRLHERLQQLALERAALEQDREHGRERQDDDPLIRDAIRREKLLKKYGLKPSSRTLKRGL